MNTTSWRRFVIFYRANRTTIVGLLIVVILASAFVYWRMPKKTIADNVALAVQTDAVSNCDQFKVNNSFGVDYYHVCTNNIAQKKATQSLDFQSCDSLDDKLMSIQECKQGIIRKKLASSNSLDTCQGLPDVLGAYCKDAYWELRAGIEKDATLCKNISASGEQQLCNDTLMAQRLFIPKSKISCSDFTDATRRDECKKIQGSDFQKKLSYDTCFDIDDIVLRNACTLQHPAATIVPKMQ